MEYIQLYYIDTGLFGVKHLIFEKYDNQEIDKSHLIKDKEFKEAIMNHKEKKIFLEIVGEENIKKYELKNKQFQMIS